MTDSARTPGDDTVIRLRVRSANLPALEQGITLGLDNITGEAIELRLIRRDDGIHDLLVITNGLVPAVTPEPVDARRIVSP